MNHFFVEAPTISWTQWLWRKVTGKSSEPKLIPTTLPTKGYPVGPTGTRAVECSPVHAKEYSQFLMLYFYSQQTQSSLRLEVPAKLFQEHLATKFWIGAEMRDSDTKLVGLVICQHAGSYESNPIGLITWLCVHPEWRHRGVTNCLLRAVYCFSQPKKIYLWRNDGMLKSPVPPILSEPHIKRQRGKSSIGGVRKVPLDSILIPYMIDTWKGMNPKGLVLYDESCSTRLVEAYECIVSKDLVYLALVVPTFERTISGQTWCEVVTWVRLGTSKSSYEDAFYMEQLIGQLPYDWIDMSESVPHLDSKWIKISPSAWCIMGLDVGTAASKPILPFHCA